MSKKKKKNKGKSSFLSKLRRFSFRLIVFIFRHKIACLIVILGFIAFFIIRKEEIINSLKDTTIRIISLQKAEEVNSKYVGKEGDYLRMLKSKYSGYGRKVSLDDARKAVKEGCDYIAKVQGHSYWNSANAQDLLLATAVAESDLRARYSQYGGNAVGIFQVEYITFKDFWNRSIPNSYPALYKAMRQDFGEIDFEMLQNNDTLCAIFARLVYSRAKTGIPYRNDTHLQAAYYKKHYNTHLGKASTDIFVKKKKSMHKLK